MRSEIEIEAVDTASAVFDLASPFNWPVMPRKHKRSLLLRRDKTLPSIRRLFHYIGACLNQDACDAYWREIEKGQDIREDAASAIWRAWAVALGLREPVDIVTMQDIERRMEESARDQILGNARRYRQATSLPPPAICVLCGKSPDRWFNDSICVECVPVHKRIGFNL